VDPLVSETGSRYGYVTDDPLNGADPSGLAGIWSIVKQAVTHPISSFTNGWNSMSTDQKIVDATLPVTLPVTVLGVVSGVGDIAGATIFGLSEGGTTAFAVGSGAAATAIDAAEYRVLHSTAACIGAGFAGGALGLSIGGALLGGSATLWGGLLASQGLAISQVGALWDILTGIRDLLRHEVERSRNQVPCGL
jgi:hypothetical protein